MAVNHKHNKPGKKTESTKKNFNGLEWKAVEDISSMYCKPS